MKAAVIIMVMVVLIATAVTVTVITRYSNATPTMTVKEYMKGIQMDVSEYERDGKKFLIFTTNKGGFSVVPAE